MLRIALAAALASAIGACASSLPSLRARSCDGYELARPAAVQACQAACAQLPERCPWREDEPDPELAPDAPPERSE